MLRPMILALSGAALLAIGACGGFFYYQYRVMELSFTNIYLARELTTARENFVMMKSIADGRHDLAFGIAEGRVLGAVMTLNAFPDKGDEAEKQTREFLSKLAVFYDEHPSENLFFTEFPEIKAAIDSAR